MAHTVVPRDPRPELSRELSTTERLKKIWIEEGIQKGVQQGVQLGIPMGIQQGVQQDRIKTILSLAQRSFTPEQVADILSLDLAEVERVLARD
jgi:predicted transposase YdaD